MKPYIIILAVALVAVAAVRWHRWRNEWVQIGNVPFTAKGSLNYQLIVNEEEIQSVIEGLPAGSVVELTKVTVWVRRKDMDNE